MRHFGKGEDAIKIKLYRDHAAWCPYCHKVWLQLEEKRIPYRIEKINMRCYGDKPAEFLSKVPSGLLPVLEVNGKVSWLIPLHRNPPRCCVLAHPRTRLSRGDLMSSGPKVGPRGCTHPLPLSGANATGRGVITTPYESGDVVGVIHHPRSYVGPRKVREPDARATLWSSLFS